MDIKIIRKLLLVDDDPDILNRIKIALENENHRVDLIMTYSPKKALNILDKEDFDCIVSDYHLSEINGVQFLEAVREKKKIDTPFILYIGGSKQETVLKALEAGADRVLHRGDDIIVFSKILNHSLGQEILNYRRKKELKHHRNLFDNNFEFFRI